MPLLPDLYHDRVDYDRCKLVGIDGMHLLQQRKQEMSIEQGR